MVDNIKEITDLDVLKYPNDSNDLNDSNELVRDAKGKLFFNDSDLLELDIKSRQILNKMSTKRQKKLVNKQVKEEEKYKKQWFLDNESNFDKEKILEKWAKLSEQASKKFIKATVKSLAIANGVQKANETLSYGLDLDGVSIEENEVSSIADKFYHLEIFKILLDESNFTPSIKACLIDRYCSTLFPYKDSLSSNSSKTSKISENIYKELLEIDRMSENLKNKNQGDKK